MVPISRDWNPPEWDGRILFDRLRQPPNPPALRQAQGRQDRQAHHEQGRSRIHFVSSLVRIR